MRESNNVLRNDGRAGVMLEHDRYVGRGNTSVNKHVHSYRAYR